MCQVKGIKANRCFNVRFYVYLARSQAVSIFAVVVVSEAKISSCVLVFVTAVVLGFPRLLKWGLRLPFF